MKITMNLIRSLFLAAAALATVAGWADEKSAIAKIEALGGTVLYVAKDAKEYNVTIGHDPASPKKITADDLKVLAELTNASEIAFQHPETADAWLAPLKGLTSLKRLHLQKTKVTDAGLDSIAGLINLEYLNLYQTGVTDVGMDKLKKLAKLKNLYLWETKVSEAKAKAFQDDLGKAGNKDLSINLGVDKDLRSANDIDRLKKQREESEKAAKAATVKVSQAEEEKYAAIKEPKFEKDILPLIKITCLECHGTEKTKGKLRLDTFDELKKGAGGKAVVVDKKSAESELLKRIMLPDSNDDRMPPKGDRLSKPVVDLIKRWIEQGAQK